jgi:predicted adenine nucleotide alpha hydrolase (AANH) superfamily ATPase
MQEKKESAPLMTRAFTSENLGIMPADSLEKKVDRLSLILHSCCGPCSSSVIERLAGEFNITVLYYNPCITDEEEYKKRRAAQNQFIEKFNAERIDLPDINFIEGPYEPGAFFEATKGHEEDPEGGQRCSICFRQRLEKAAETAAFMGFDIFGTTLTVSPHKNYEIISAIGKDIAARYGVSFLDRDFKKQDGFKRSIELSKKYNLYRQNYCGCVYSDWRDK